jgi:hypothetical protein
MYFTEEEEEEEVKLLDMLVKSFEGAEMLIETIPHIW